MAFVNLARRELHCKIVYYGPGSGGKTTNIVALFQRLPADRRGQLVSLKTEGDRTLYFDFLPLDLGRIGALQTRLHIYTVPGQPRCSATRRVVLQGVDGVVFVADSDRDRLIDNRQSLDDLRTNLALLHRPLAALPLVFQYNKRDLPATSPCARLEQTLNAAGHPAIEAVAIRGEGVQDTLKMVLRLVLLGLTQRDARTNG